MCKCNTDKVTEYIRADWVAPYTTKIWKYKGCAECGEPVGEVEVKVAPNNLKELPQTWREKQKPVTVEERLGKLLTIDSASLNGRSLVGEDGRSLTNRSMKSAFGSRLGE